MNNSRISAWSRKGHLFAGAGIAAISLVALSAPAYAQDSTQDSTTSSELPSDADVTSQPSESDSIVVTGSRIRRDEYSTPSLVQVIGRDESTVAGFTTSAEALQSTAVTGGSEQINNAFGGYVTNGGPGANTLSLRGLGATRTLVLLNGRRLSPAGSRGSVGSTDLNVIPSLVIDHYEILKDGASSIYGSDAVAGVVNIITRNKVNGVELEGGVSVPEVGAGVQKNIGLVFGKTGDRWSVTGSLEYYERNELSLGDRDFTRCQTQGFLNSPDLTPDSGSVTDPITGKPKCYTIGQTGENGVTINTIGTAYLLGTPAPGATSDGSFGAGRGAYNRWRPNAAITGGSFPGFEGVGGSYPGFETGLNVRDTFDPRMLNQSLISPVKTYTGFLQASYDVGVLGNAEAYIEFLGNRRESSQTGYRQLSLDYGVDDDLLLPANLQGLPAFLNPTEISNGQLVAVRAFIGAGNDTSSQKVDFYRVGGGLRGDFFIPGWRYDLYGGATWSDADYTFESFLTNRLSQSLDVVANPGGGLSCSDPSGGCVAAPILTDAVIGGQLPADWMNYVFVPVTGTTKYREQLISLGLDGDLFKLPYGTVKAFIGGEIRWDKIDDTPPIESQNGQLYNLTSATPTRGSDSVKEVFGEVEVPLLAGLPGAEQLTLNGSARFTDYKSYGSEFTYKIGGMYSPFNFVTFRGTYGTSYRAPALFEQFLGETSGFLSSSNDPCDNFGSRDPNSTIYKNCIADGLPTDFEQKNSVSVISKGGAENNLIAETSTNWTVGVILQPKFSSSFGDLSFAVDYYNIDVSNGVARPSGRSIASQCYSDPEFRSGGGLCRLVSERGPNNELTVESSYINVAVDKTSGIDYNLRYARDIGTARFRLNAQATQYLHVQSKIFPDDPLEEYKGLINTPEWSATLDARLTYQQVSLNYGLSWIQGTDSTKYLLGEDANYGDLGYDFKVPDYWTHYMSVQFKGDNFTLTAGVRNMFDSKVPTISAGYYNRVGNAPLYSGYDYVGRTFYLNMTTKL
ncbi:TonB-dependent receptor domain-containing protein [Tsuneonella suprasediminis]|uniref:TonB-dependent receptor domain-containing protein n=1 Tax=Tsuneonella suprasediminis TaxID=2306996 RepID=UPI002F95480E